MPGQYQKRAGCPRLKEGWGSCWLCYQFGRGGDPMAVVGHMPWFCHLRKTAVVGPCATSLFPLGVKSPRVT